MSKGFTAFTFTLIFLLSAVFLHRAMEVVGPNSPTASTAAIGVDPLASRAEVGQTFMINIKISDVIDLYGWEFKLRWNNTLLEALNTTEGTFLKGGGNTFFVSKINNTVGYMLVDCSLVGDVPGVTGNGILATIEFCAETRGECVLDLYNTKLVSSFEQPITHSTFDGSVNVIEPPIASFTYLPSSPNVDESVTFDASASTPNGGTIVSYQWNFGDGNTTTVTNPIITHAYIKVGDYNVTLTIVDNEGLNDITWAIVMVYTHDIAIIGVTLSATEVCAEQIVNITVVVKNEGNVTENFNVTAYYDGNAIGTQTINDLAEGMNKTLMFSWVTTGVTPDNYTIKAEASVVLGETDIADNTYVDGTVKVMKPPTAAFTYSPPSPRAGETVTFDASSSTPDGGTIISYSWDFDDGNTTTTSHSIITHMYSSEETYNVNLTITDSNDLTDSTWQVVGVGVALYHDIAIINVTTSHLEAYVTQIINITVTAENQGDYVETFNITAYYNDQVAGNETVLDLNPGANTTLTIRWDTTEVTTCQNYTIKAEATIIPGETEIEDNTLTDGKVEMKLSGDANGDHTVNYKDLFQLAQAYGTFLGDPDYNPDADFNGDNKIDYLDLFKLAANYGKAC